MPALLINSLTATCLNCNINLILQRMSVRRRVKWAENVKAWWNKFHVGKTDGKKKPARLRHRREANIEIGLREKGYQI